MKTAGCFFKRCTAVPIFRKHLAPLYFDLYIVVVSARLNSKVRHCMQKQLIPSNTTRIFSATFDEKYSAN